MEQMEATIDELKTAELEVLDKIKTLSNKELDKIKGIFSSVNVALKRKTCTLTRWPIPSAKTAKAALTFL